MGQPPAPAAGAPQLRAGREWAMLAVRLERGQGIGLTHILLSIPSD